MSALGSFRRLLRSVPSSMVTALLLLMVLCGLTEGVGILMLVPLLESLNGGSFGWGHRVLQLLPPSIRLPGIGGLLLLFVILVAARSAAQFGRDQLSQRLQHRVVDTLRHRCFEALLAAEWRWLASRRRADHADLLLTSVNRIGLGLQYCLNLAAGTATMAACVLSAFALSWSMTLLALLSGALVFMGLSGQRRGALRLGYDLTQASRSLHRSVQETMSGIKLAKILGTENRHLKQFDATTAGYRAQQLEFTSANSRSLAVFQIGGATLLAGYLFLGLQVWHTPIPVLLTLILLFGRLIPLFLSMHQQLHHWLHSLPALIETEQMLADCARQAEPRAGVADDRCPMNRSLRLRNVTVRHEERRHPALDNLSLEFAARTTTAIMGESGAGKSTLADVVMGLLVPDSGDVLLDGQSISGSLRRGWRSQVSYVPQEVFLFHDSIRNNLLWAMPNATDDELRLALQRAAADFVFRLPHGLETIVGDSGGLLSGGERQRIALARALLRRPALLILDEATSALDTANEARIQSAIEQLHGDLTVIIIGHRLPTLEHADQVVLLDHGRVLASGTWKEVRPLLRQAPAPA